MGISWTMHNNATLKIYENQSFEQRLIFDFRGFLENDSTTTIVVLPQFS